MKHSICNIALPPNHGLAELTVVREAGLQGLEVAPSRVWEDTWHGLTPKAVESYGQAIAAAGLEVVGLHSLFWDQPDLGLFRDQETRKRTMAFLVHLSGLCRDLGGRTLIYGSAPARRRDKLSIDDAMKETLEFFSDLCSEIADHGTCYCFEPLAPKDGDFINSAYEAIAVAEQLDHPSFRVQLDAKALLANGEAEEGPFVAARPYLKHFHANEPDMSVLVENSPINHSDMGKHLKQISYEGFVSIEQRMIDEKSWKSDIARSAQVVRQYYR